MARDEELIDPSIAKQYDRLPPHSIEAEQCLLGSMILISDRERRLLYAKIRESMEERGSDFYQVDHQVVFKVLLDLEKTNRPSDVTILREELIARNLYEDIGGAAYLGQLLNTVPSAAHAEHYMAIVIEKSKLRQVISTANDMIRLCYRPASLLDRSEDILHRSIRELSDIQRTGKKDSIIRVGEAARQFMDRYGKSGMPAIPTGIQAWDDVIGGVWPGLVHCIGALPSMGKSQMLKQICHNVADRNVGSLLITVEENNDKVSADMLANVSGVSNTKIKRGTMTEDEYCTVMAAVQPLLAMPFYTQDTSETVREVISQMTIAAIEYEVKVIGIDYLQLVQSDGDFMNETTRLNALSIAVKMAAKRLGVALINALQIKEPEPVKGKKAIPRRPVRGDLKGTSNFATDSDIIVLLHREDYHRRNQPGYQFTNLLEGIVVKNKSNATATMRMHFDGATQQITDWTEADAEAGDIAVAMNSNLPAEQQEIPF